MPAKQEGQRQKEFKIRKRPSFRNEKFASRLEREPERWQIDRQTEIGDLGSISEVHSRKRKSTPKSCTLTSNHVLPCMHARTLHIHIMHLSHTHARTHAHTYIPATITNIIKWYFLFWLLKLTNKTGKTSQGNTQFYFFLLYNLILKIWNYTLSGQIIISLKLRFLD